MTTQVHSVLLKASDAAMFVLSLVEAILDLGLVILEDAMKGLINFINWSGKAIARHAEHKASENARLEFEARLARVRAREQAKFPRPTSGGFFSGLVSFVVTALFLMFCLGLARHLFGF